MTNIYLKQQIISFYSMQGGAGRTTAALNLAWFLQGLPKAKVLFVDFNFSVGQSDTAMKMNFPACPNLCSFVEKIENPYIAYKESILSFKDFKAHFIQPPLSLLQSDKFSIDMLNELIYLARNDYDFIIADLPSGYANICMEMLNISTIICFVSTMESIAGIPLYSVVKRQEPKNSRYLTVGGYTTIIPDLQQYMVDLAGRMLLT